VTQSRRSNERGTAQERLAAKRAAAAAAKAQAARRKRMLMILAPVVVVIVVLGVFFGVYYGTKGGSKKPSANTTPTGTSATGTSAPTGGSLAGPGADAAMLAKVVNVSASVLDQVGAGTTSGGLQPADGDPVTGPSGKPLVLYVGAEFCPFCAGERWPVVVALSRFGTFTGLGETTSSSTDTYPDTATLSFHGSSYTSAYIDFTGIESSDREQKPLDTISPSDQAIFQKYSPKGYIPLAVFGNQFYSGGASFDPGVLQGKTQAQIADALSDPTSAIAQAIDGSANMLTAAICKMTDGQPAAVCQSAGVQAGAAKLPQKAS